MAGRVRSKRGCAEEPRRYYGSSHGGPTQKVQYTGRNEDEGWQRNLRSAAKSWAQRV